MRDRGTHDEISTAAALRRKACDQRRHSSRYRFDGLERHADHLAAHADLLEEMARLVETAPFESEARGPACLSRMLYESVWPERRAVREARERRDAAWVA